MGRFAALLALALLTAAEVAAVLAIVESVGASTALLLLAFDALAGMVVMRSAITLPPGERGWRWAAGAFIVLPGFVLDIVGVLLLVPRVRAILKERVLRSTESALRRHGVSVIRRTDAAGAGRTTVVPGEVIPGQVVDDGDAPRGPDTRTDRPGAGGAPGSGPSIVRGEIAEE
jgi:UPF0716 protein FxsA